MEKESTMELDYKKSQQYYYERCFLLEEENTILHKMSYALPVEKRVLPVHLLEKWDEFNQKWENAE